MIKDITLGQYFPGSSVVHNLDARFKLVITLLFIIMLFIGGNAICCLLYTSRLLNAQEELRE